jgi:hypothetical protein
MIFNDILRDTNCGCIDDTIEDNGNLFARKINKPIPLDKDFASHWERGKRAENCKEICGFKGLSMNLWNETTKNDVIDKFLTTFSITPKHKDSIFVLKFLPNAGVIKKTPTKYDATHHDFYKSDEFSLELLEHHTIIHLKNFIK